MKRNSKQKECGFDGRKRRKLQEEAAHKSSMFFKKYLGMSSSESASSSKELPTSSCALQSEVSVDCSVQDSDDINAVISQCEEIRINEATGTKATEEVEENIIAPLGPQVASSVEMGDNVENSINVIPEAIKQRDLGLLLFDKDTGKSIVSDSLRIEIVKMGSKYFQNIEGPFLPTNKRCMNRTWFKKKIGNRGEEVTRSWLVYSPSKKSAFCICCLLFSKLKIQSSLEHENGFTIWKAPDRIVSHENARNHRNCFTQWKEMDRNFAANKGIIDVEFQHQVELEKQKWRDILKRILHCIKFLATQNLALRGHRESLSSSDDLNTSNAGNFLGLLKLLAVFDPIMKNHLGHVSNNPGTVSYFSPLVQNEFVHLMASTVRQRLLQSIHKAKYYGLMFDSTPDQANREQMSEVVRDVEVDFEQKSVRIRESFLGFIQIRQKDAASLVTEIVNQLEKDDMNLQDCRSQCYDNAAVMSGHRTGVQQRIIEKNNLAIFVNCDNHSLNLVGVHAAKQEAVMVTFFGTIQALYVFFSIPLCAGINSSSPCL